jgi:hypothetical protein
MAVFRDALRARKLRAEAKINIRNNSSEHLFTHAEQFGRAKLKGSSGAKLNRN